MIATRRAGVVTMCVLGWCATIAGAQPTTTVITHGLTITTKGEWVQGMGEAIAARAGGADIYRYQDNVTGGRWRLVCGDGLSSNAVLVFNWAEESDGVGSFSENWGFTQAAGDALYAALRDPMYQSASGVADDTLGPADLVTGRVVHLLGHSRGACVNSAAARRLAAAGIPVDQVTAMDPHPVNGTLDHCLGSSSTNWGDPVPTKWDIVSWMDNYWRADGGGLINSCDPDGMELLNALNVQLDGQALGSYGYTFEHSDVHLWLHGTIDELSTPYCDGRVCSAPATGTCIDANGRASWWPSSDWDIVGYFYSHIGGGSALRPAQGAGVSPGAVEVLCNGSFDNDSAAGWAFHGGNASAPGVGTLQSDAGNWYMRLDPGNEGITHNRFFLPLGADAVTMDVRVFTGVAGNFVALLLVEARTGAVIPVGSVDASASTPGFAPVTIPLPPGNPEYRGRVYTLSALLDDGAGSPGAAVGLDNIAITVSPVCAGDVDANGTVDVSDVSYVIFRLGATGAPGSVDGDADANGVVDVNDISFVIFRLGVC